MPIPPLETTAVDKTSTLGGHPKNIKETPVYLDMTITTLKKVLICLCKQIL